MIGEETLAKDSACHKLHRVQITVSLELSSSLGGEEILFAMLNTHMRCLQVTNDSICASMSSEMHKLFAHVNAYYDKVRCNR